MNGRTGMRMHNCSFGHMRLGARAGLAVGVNPTTSVVDSLH